jgi:hypothetical protein
VKVIKPNDSKQDINNLLMSPIPEGGEP